MHGLLHHHQESAPLHSFLLDDSATGKMKNIQVQWHGHYWYVQDTVQLVRPISRVHACIPSPCLDAS